MTDDQPKKRGRKPKTKTGPTEPIEPTAQPQPESTDLLADPVASVALIPAAATAATNSIAPAADSELLPLSRYVRYTTVRVNRSRLNPAPYNPREISPAAKLGLRDSIKTHGLVGDIVWNIRTEHVVAGHQRLDRIDELEGNQNYSLEVKQIDVDLATEKALNIALNNPNLQGQYKIPELLDLFAEQNRDLEWLDQTGFRPLDLEMMALDHGLDAGYIDSMFTPAAQDLLNNIGDQINDIIDQSDELKRRRAEDAKRNGSNSGSGNSGSSSAANSTGSNGSSAPAAVRPRRQSQDEDDGDDSDSEHNGSRYSSQVDPSRTESDASHAHSANTSGAAAKPLTEAQKSLLAKGAARNGSNSGQSGQSGSSSPSVRTPEMTAEYFRSQKSKLSEAMLAQRDADFWVCLCFPGSVQKREFCDAFGIDPAEVMLDGMIAAELMGFKLTKLQKAQKPELSDDVQIPFADARST